MVHDIINEMIQLNGEDTRRINHALKVYGLAVCIAGRERYSETDLLVVSLSAVLHDIAIRHCEAIYGSCGGKLQEKEGPGIARPMLTKYTDDEELIEHVCDIIAHHHTYLGIDDICHQAIIEADFLVNFDEGEFERSAFEGLSASISKQRLEKSWPRPCSASPNTKAWLFSLDEKDMLLLYLGLLKFYMERCLSLV